MSHAQGADGQPAIVAVTVWAAGCPSHPAGPGYHCPWPGHVPLALRLAAARPASEVRRLPGRPGHQTRQPLNFKLNPGSESRPGGPAEADNLGLRGAQAGEAGLRWRLLRLRSGTRRAAGGEGYRHRDRHGGTRKGRAGVGTGRGSPTRDRDNMYLAPNIDDVTLSARAAAGPWPGLAGHPNFSMAWRTESGFDQSDLTSRI
jgi:hypothetical protein